MEEVNGCRTGLAENRFAICRLPLVCVILLASTLCSADNTLMCTIHPPAVPSNGNVHLYKNEELLETAKPFKFEAERTVEVPFKDGDVIKLIEQVSHGVPSLSCFPPSPLFASLVQEGTNSITSLNVAAWIYTTL